MMMSTTIQTFDIPKKEDVSVHSKKYFDYFKERLGTMPNLFAVFAYSDYALESYFHLHSRKHHLNRQEIEVISLIVATIFECAYCQERHKMAARLNDFSEEQIHEITHGSASFHPQLNALTRLVYRIAANRGNVENYLLSDFFAVGYTTAHLVDVLLSIGENTIANMVCNTMNVPPDGL